MNHFACVIVSCVLGLAGLGCGGANMNQVHEPHLLDDKVLQQRVQAALSSAGPGFQNVLVHADRGSVVLGGTVGSARAREQAEDISRGVYGVKQVQDKIEVSAPRP